MLPIPFHFVWHEALLQFMMKVIISKREFLERKSKICADNSSSSALRGILWAEGPSQAEKWEGSR